MVLHSANYMRLTLKGRGENNYLVCNPYQHWRTCASEARAAWCSWGQPLTPPQGEAVLVPVPQNSIALISARLWAVVAQMVQILCLFTAGQDLRPG